MTTKAQPPADAGAPPRRAGAGSWRCCCSCCCLAAAARRRLVGRPPSRRPRRRRRAACGTARRRTPCRCPLCSDDDDPKYLEHLDFGPPVETRSTAAASTRCRTGRSPTSKNTRGSRRSWSPSSASTGCAASSSPPAPTGRLLAVASPGDGLRPHRPDGHGPREGALRLPRRRPGARVVAGRGVIWPSSCGDGVVRLYDVRNLDKIPDPWRAGQAAAGLVTSLVLFRRRQVSPRRRQHAETRRRLGLGRGRRSRSSTSCSTPGR